MSAPSRKSRAPDSFCRSGFSRDVLDVPCGSGGSRDARDGCRRGGFNRDAIAHCLVLTHAE
jgi:hypothetical protein